MMLVIAAKQSSDPTAGSLTRLGLTSNFRQTTTHSRTLGITPSNLQPRPDPKPLPTSSTATSRRQQPTGPSPYKPSPHPLNLVLSAHYVLIPFPSTINRPLLNKLNPKTPRAILQQHNPLRHSSADSSHGRVNIGRRCIIQERTHLGGLFDFGGPGASPEPSAPGSASASGRNSLVAAATTTTTTAGLSSRDSVGLNLHRTGGGGGVRDSLLSTGSRDSISGSSSVPGLNKAVLLTGNGVSLSSWGKDRKSTMEGTGTLMVVLGDYVTVEVGTILEPGVRVDEGTTIGVGCVVGAGAEIGKNCTLAPYTIIQPGEKLPDSTVVFCGNQRRTDTRAKAQADLRRKIQGRQIDVSRRMIKSDPSKFQ
ncbi:trimeric LpxA-like protein [Zalerion maritima]|uniref:Dynactin subunit 6 n=1 Tax=Zalerion maritima TaxID=339359 RepID=A0AAD5RT60_9PEZI|nr:trimeric LpxA-like protein [Zalerion maritima]